jgi:hypothetical protein
MNHRWSELLAAETITAAATKTIDVDLADPISRISVLFKLTNNGSTPTAHPAASLPKLELVDGSDVLASLNGYEFQALNFYERAIEPFMALIYLDNVMALLQFDLNFGRWLYDPDLALDPKKFRNLQLKIQHSLALGGSAPDSMDLRVRADVFDDKPISPVGFLQSKEVYSYSLVSSGNEYINLPNDHPIRKLMILSRAASKAPYEQYNQLKLTEEQDKKTVLEGYTSDFQKVVAGLYPLWKDRIFGSASAAGVAHFLTPCFDAYPSLNAEGTSAQIYTEAFVNGGTKTIHGDVTSNFHGLYSGLCPHGAIAFQMGDEKDLDDWWDVTKLTNARLKITAGSSIESSSTCQVVTQQLRRY